MSRLLCSLFAVFAVYLSKVPEVAAQPGGGGVGAPSAPDRSQTAAPVATTGVSAPKADANEENGTTNDVTTTAKEIVKARCASAIYCYEQWFGFELFAEVPIGGVWLLKPVSMESINGVKAIEQLQNQFNGFAFTATGGVRFWGPYDVASLGFALGAIKTDKTIILEGPQEERVTLGTGSAILFGPAIVVGLGFDSVQVAFQHLRFVNVGESQTFSNGETIRRNDTVAKSWVVGLGFQPVTLVRTAAGALRNNGTTD